VQDSGAVSCGEARQNLTEHFKRPHRRQRAILAQGISQGDSRHVFHDQVGDRAIRALVENVNQIRVRQFRGRLGL